jgi:hypothetical protein
MAEDRISQHLKTPAEQPFLLIFYQVAPMIVEVPVLFSFFPTD